LICLSLNGIVLEILDRNITTNLTIIDHLKQIKEIDEKRKEFFKLLKGNVFENKLFHLKILPEFNFSTKIIA